MIKIKDIAIISFFAMILFVQEQLLTFIPNVQLTVFLLVLYSKVFKFYKTILIILIHTLLDNIFMGSFSLYYTPFMFIGWCFISVMICTFCKKTQNVIILAIFGLFCSLIYCWCFIIPAVLLTHINVLVYLANDVIFEIIMASCSFLTILWLYKPCFKILNNLINKDICSNYDGHV